MWDVSDSEPHGAALQPGDVALVYLAAPIREFVARAEVASAVRRWTPQEAEALPGASPGGVLLRRVRRWVPPVPMRSVLAEVDPSERAHADFDAAVVRITDGEYTAAVRVATRGTPDP
jgi:hypothetical protein